MDYIPYPFYIFSIVWLVAYFLYLCVHFVALTYGFIKLHRLSLPANIDGLPGISILKPVVTPDSNLYENLDSFFKLTYPKFELLFCVEDEKDSAVMIIETLRRKHPHVDCKLLTGGSSVGINPKINNMLPGYKAAQYEWLYISDQAIYADAHQLYDLVSEIREDVGLIHQIPYYKNCPGFKSTVQQVFFGTQHAKAYLYLAAFGTPATNGMACMYRKEVIDEAGGLEAFGKYLAEDFFLAQQYFSKGWKVRLARRVALQNPCNRSLAAFQARMVRWSKLRFSMLPFLLVFEPLGECMLLGALTSYFSSIAIENCSPLLFFLCHCLFWFLEDYLLFRIVNNGPPEFSKLDFLLSWLFREFTSLPITIRAWSSPRISWRGRQFRIRLGGLVEEITPSPAVPTKIIIQ